MPAAYDREEIRDRISRRRRADRRRRAAARGRPRMLSLRPLLPRQHDQQRRRRRIAGEAIVRDATCRTWQPRSSSSCLSRQALERAATAEGVKVEVRVKDTRARLVEHFKDGTWHYPGRPVHPSAEAIADLAGDEADEPTAEDADGEGVGTIGGGTTEPDGEDPTEDMDEAYAPPVAEPSPGLAIAAE